MANHPFHHLGSSFVSALVMTACLPLLGCGSAPPTGAVSGKVTYKGQPVEEGWITFEPVTGVGGAGGDAPLNSEGVYAITTPLLVGDYKVFVMPPTVREKADPKGPVVGVEKLVPNIPMKYRTVGTTALKATVTAGKNDLNFDMTPD